MFKNTRLSAVLAAVLFSVTAAAALVSAPAFADAPASAAATAAPAASAPAADAAAPAADAAAPAAPAGAKEEVENPFGIQAVWAGGFVPRATLVILSLMSMGSWYIIITKLIDQMKIFKQSKETSAKFWKASSIAAGSASLKEGSPFRFIAESGTKATEHHDGALLEQIDLSTWVTMSV
ncbi:MAG: biopolymer transporter ExbB, partial [Massilia sp.]|nr:biopolymer transporter ExbB [Massilia sp.]